MTPQFWKKLQLQDYRQASLKAGKAYKLSIQKYESVQAFNVKNFIQQQVLYRYIIQHFTQHYIQYYESHRHQHILYFEFIKSWTSTQKNFSTFSNSSTTTVSTVYDGTHCTESFDFIVVSLWLGSARSRS